MLKCHIIRQLMPNYIDDLLDNESRKDVEEHLADCANCSAVLHTMRLEIASQTGEDQPAQLNYLKGVRRRSTAVLLLAALLLLVLFGLFLKVFVWGSPVQMEDMAVKVYSVYDSESQESILMLDFALQSGKTLWMRTHYLEQENGETTGVILTPRATANSPLNDSGPAFQYGYHLSSGGDFQITVRYGNEKVVYDMRDWVD